MRRPIRWAPAVAQTVAWCAFALIGVSLALAQFDQAGKAEGKGKTAPSVRTPDTPADRASDQPKTDDNARRREPAKGDEERATAPRDQARPPARGESEREGQRTRRAADGPTEQPPADREGTTRRGRDNEARGNEVRRRPAGLGLSIEDQGEGSLTVTNIEQGSAAAQSGFRVNDRIVSADGRRFASPRQLQAYLGGQFGRRVPIIIERGGRQYTVQFTPSGGEEGAWLGVYMEDDDENQVGARVTHVYPTSPAARAGFRPGDVILQVNGQKVENSPDVIALVEEQEPGSRAEFVVRRNDQETKLVATLGRRDAYVSYGRQQPDRQEGEFSDEDPYSRVPPYVMQLEHDRRMAEQHQRIEEALRDLQEEVKQLRAEIGKQR